MDTHAVFLIRGTGGHLQQLLPAREKMNRISGIPYPFRTQKNQFSLCQKMPDNMYNQQFSSTFNRAKTASVFCLILAILAAVAFAIVLTLILPAGALYLMAAWFAPFIYLYRNIWKLYSTLFASEPTTATVRHKLGIDSIEYSQACQYHSIQYEKHQKRR